VSDTLICLNIYQHILNDTHACLFRGHLLLVGVGGSGKHSIARLAAFAASCEIFEITITRGYNEDSFKADLKTLFNKLMTQPTVFLFSSAQVSLFFSPSSLALLM
jgi:hypothetical protein